MLCENVNKDGSYTAITITWFTFFIIVSRMRARARVYIKSILT